MRSRLRIWANRDDGRFFRLGNQDVGWPAVLGTLVLISAVVLRVVVDLPFGLG